METGILEKETVISLGKLISGEVAPEKDVSRIFKSVGMALFDLMMASKIYETHMKTN